MKQAAETLKVEITAKTILFTLGLIVFLYLLVMLKDVFIHLFIAFIFMSALKPTVDALEAKKIPRVIAAVFVILLSLGIFFGFMYYTLPVLVIQTRDFILFASGEIFKSLRQIDSNLTPQDLFPIQTLSQHIPDITGTITQIVFSLFGNVLDFISLFFFTLYFLLGITTIKKTVTGFLNSRQIDFFMETISNVERRLGAWVRGELVLMLIIAVMSYIGLTLLGVKYALPLAVIAGLLEIFPIVGPIISAIPAFFVASTSSWLLGTAVIALYTIIQQLENNLIVPLVMKKAVGISPLIVLISLVVGQRLAGFAGAILAVPVVATATIITHEFFKYRTKGSHTSEEKN